MTKQEYLEAIERQVQSRRNAITAIAELTKTFYTEEDLLNQARIASDAYHATVMLRQQMKIAFPTPCTCACDQHKQEAK